MPEPANAAPSNSIHLDLNMESVRLLYRSIPLSLLTNFSLALLVCWSLWDQLNHSLLLYWLAAMSAICLIRGMSFRRFNRHPLTIESANRWKYRFIFYCILSGVLWGTSIWIFGPYADIRIPLLITFSMAGMTAGASTTLGPVPQAYATYAMSTGVPLVGWYFSQGSEFEFDIGMMICIYIVFLLANGYSTRAGVVSSIKLSNSLIDSKDQAESAHQAKSDFLSSMSHELRTPLTAIIGFGQLLDVSDINDANREKVTYMIKAGEHLAGMIDNILDVTRIEAGGYEISKEPVLVSQILTDAWALMLPMASEGGVTLANPIAEDIGTYVNTDRQLLQQILINLISNAIKYNNTDGQISLIYSIDQTCTIRISIKDTGPGIAPEFIDRIFKPFDRLGADRSNIVGSGIGLTLSKSLAEILGGELGVVSQLGQGSTFWVELPVGEISAVTDIPTKLQIDKGVADEGPQAGSTRIVYIEDNPTALILVREILKTRPNTELFEAALGEQGYELILKQ
ncbi:MAG: hypothetical protein JKY89_04120 [Immundisolibacteraceae bacterium]|nr:hypothetical protein [Immundisolibacteraceae bacterium]